MSDDASHNILVLGASGLIGRYLTDDLRARGFHAIGIARQFTAAQKMSAADLELPLMSMDVADLTQLLRTHEVNVVVNCLGVLQDGPGSDTSAVHRDFVARLLEAIRDSHRDPAACTRVQDAYSLRCAPQVHGGARDTVEHAATIAGHELASAIDNPVVTLDGRVESNGNFHGAPVAYVLDFLAIVAADVASMSERRTDRFLDVARNHGLPPFLAHDPGTDSGLMIAQYTAAGMVSEMKRLAAPASVDSIPSSAMQEDHVSMGWAGAHKLRRSVDALARVVAVELHTAARGIALRAPLRPAPATAAVIETLTAHGRTEPGPDRFAAPDLAAAHLAVVDGSVLAAAESATGPLA